MNRFLSRPYSKMLLFLILLLLSGQLFSSITKASSNCYLKQEAIRSINRNNDIDVSCKFAEGYVTKVLPFIHAYYHKTKIIRSDAFCDGGEYEVEQGLLIPLAKWKIFTNSKNITEEKTLCL